MVNAAGNSTEKLNYRITDNDPSYSEYYRLSQYDFDGSVHSQKPLESIAQAQIILISAHILTQAITSLI